MEVREFFLDDFFEVRRDKFSIGFTHFNVIDIFLELNSELFRLAFLLPNILVIVGVFKFFELYSTHFYCHKLFDTKNQNTQRSTYLFINILYIFISILFFFYRTRSGRKRYLYIKNLDLYGFTHGHTP